MRFDECFIRKVLPDAAILYKSFPEEPLFSIDSRTIRAPEIFVAITGSHYDGHDFIAQAFNAGAAGCIIDEAHQEKIAQFDKNVLAKKLIILVSNAANALVSLACAWRAQFSYPVIGVTGSAGKTSTKETIASIMRKAGKRFIASHGNQNTRIGASLNIFRMRDYHEVAIFEMGIQKRGEMAELARIVRPTTAVITNIGHAHMEWLGSLHDIALEKRDIFKYFSADNIGVINGDQSILSQVSYQHPVIKFGSKTTNQIQARKIRVIGSHISFTLKIYKEKFQIEFKRPHVSAVFNVLAASAIAYQLGIASHDVVAAIQAPPVIVGRFEQRQLKETSGILIHDAYNANPESMKAALLAFQQIETRAQKIAVLGDMLELGVNSPFWHRQLGRFLRKIPSLKRVILVGEQVKWTKKTAPVGLHVDLVPTWQKSIDLLKGHLSPESVILVKASRGIGLYHLVDELSNESSPTTIKI